MSALGRWRERLADSPFFQGMARAFDPYGNMNLPMPYAGEDPWKADQRALASDWAAVRGDMSRAADRLAAEMDPDGRVDT